LSRWLEAEIRVHQAFELNFLAGFTKYTVLPSVVAGIVAFPILFFAFKSKPITSKIDKTSDGSNEFIPAVFEKPDVDPRSALVDPAGAIFHAVLLLTTLAVLVGTSFIKTVEVWMITAPAGLLGFARDLISDWRAGHGTRIVPGTTDRIEANGIKSPAIEESDPSGLSPPRTTLPSLWRKAKTRLPNASITFSRLPWPLLPFAVGMFILVRSLQHFGYIDIFAGWAVKVCTSPAAAVFFVGSIVAFGLCPLAGTVSPGPSSVRRQS
jgi:Na+/H+ antiporter NhaD/arsenite permease-like protein